MHKKTIFTAAVIGVLSAATGYKKGMNKFNKIMQTPRLGNINNLYTPYNRTSNHPRNP